LSFDLEDLEITNLKKIFSLQICFGLKPPKKGVVYITLLLELYVSSNII